MTHIKKIDEYIHALKRSPELGGQVAYHHLENGKDGRLSVLSFDAKIAAMLSAAGINELYLHQVKGLENVRKGRHVVVATPTASGKTLIFFLPLIEKVIQYPYSRAIFIYPLKALANDQLNAFGKLTKCLSGFVKWTPLSRQVSLKDKVVFFGVLFFSQPFYWSLVGDASPSSPPSG